MDHSRVPPDTEATTEAKTPTANPENTTSLPESNKADEKTEIGSPEWAKSFPTDVAFVHIFVGPSKKEFILPKIHLCRCSPYFNRAFNGAFAEAVTSELHLPEDDPQHFTYFTKWLFGEMKGKELESFDEALKSQDFIDGYAFADKFQCDEMKNFTIDHLQNHLKNTDGFLSEGEMEFIFANSVTSYLSSPIRAFCAAIMSYYILKEVLPTTDITMMFENVPGLLEEYIKFQGSLKWTRWRLHDDPRHRHLFDEYRSDNLCIFHAHMEPMCDYDAEPNCEGFCRPKKQVEYSSGFYCAKCGYSVRERSSVSDCPRDCDGSCGQHHCRA